MQTEAVFENIAERIQQEIEKAQNSVVIAVAWFTNRHLFQRLLMKAMSGCVIKLIVSDDEINSTLDFNQLNIFQSRVYKVGDGNKELMHNKFCVIDYNTVISGSYNWSYKAESNFENVVITTEDTTLAAQFISEFNNILKQYYPEEAHEDILFPLYKIIMHLEILKNYILLEDIEELTKETRKLKVYEFNKDIEEVVKYVLCQDYAEAVIKIQNFISKNQQISIWTDPELAALKFEIKNLEYQLNAFSNEKAELEKLLNEFQHRHTAELGEIIIELLRLRKIKYKDDKDKFDEAEKDENGYKEQYDIESAKEIFVLNEVQKKELKKNFRRATILCHPDKFANEPIEIQQQAEEVFKELNEANEKNDLKRVNEILTNLEKGILKSIKGDQLIDKERLRTTILNLKAKIIKLEQDIIAIKSSDTYTEVSEINDWDDYFRDIKVRLQKELDELRLEFEPTRI